MKIPIEVDVQCTDGDAGHTSAIILDPATRQVTHVVVKGKGTLLGEFLVPLEMIDQCTPYALILRWSREKLAAASRFDKAIIVDASDSPVGSDLAWPNGNVDDINFGSPAPSAFVQVEEVPGSEVALHVGAHVDATDGRVGKVHEFVINRKNGAISHMILRHGHLWKKEDIAVPVASIEYIADDIVHLTLDKAGVEALPVEPRY